MAAARFDGIGVNELKSAVDAVRDRIKPAVVVLGTVSEGNVFVVCSVSPEAVKDGVKAGSIIKEISAMIGGKGGGKDQFAQGGGKDPGKLAEALERVKDLVREELKR